MQHRFCGLKLMLQFNGTKSQTEAVQLHSLMTASTIVPTIQDIAERYMVEISTFLNPAIANYC